MGEEMIPMPPDEYKKLVCGERSDLFEEVGRGAVGFMKSLEMLGEGVRFLDVGCGCGRIARYLVEEPLESYVGFDRHPGMIDWCREHIATRHANYQFDFFALKSAYVNLDGYGGSEDVESFTFPYENSAFDSILLTSVFTHMPMPEIDRYLAQLNRVLAPEGRILASVLLAKDEPWDNGADFWLDRDAWIDLIEKNRLSWKSLTDDDRAEEEQRYFLLTKESAT